MCVFKNKGDNKQTHEGRGTKELNSLSDFVHHRKKCMCFKGEQMPGFFCTVSGQNFLKQWVTGQGHHATLIFFVVKQVSFWFFSLWYWGIIPTSTQDGTGNQTWASPVPGKHCTPCTPIPLSGLLWVGVRFASLFVFIHISGSIKCSVAKRGQNGKKCNIFALPSPVYLFYRW